MPKRLTWGGNAEAQRAADEAYSRLKPKKGRKKTKNLRATTRKVKQQVKPVNYSEYMHSKTWRFRRNSFIRLAGGKCQECKSGSELTIHHLHYDSLGHERFKDVQVLCWECHQNKHPDKAALDRRLSLESE